MKKIICWVVSFIHILPFISFTTSASQNDFEMKEFDRGYITFVFDDNNMPFTDQCYQIFKMYNMPMCCAVIANKVENNPQLISVLKEIQKSGGEVLSHTYDHTTFVKDTPQQTIEEQLGKSFTVLRGLGFNVNGVIETGNGGGEKYADYEKIETATRKYYKYSNTYGVSAQYKKTRTWLSGYNTARLKKLIDEAIAEKKWVVLSAHNAKEIPFSSLKEILSYISEKGEQNVKVVNWNYIYENFGVYTGPQVPSQEALNAVDEYIKINGLDPISSSEISNTGSSNIKSNNDGSGYNTVVDDKSDLDTQTPNSVGGNKAINIVLISVIIIATILICATALFFGLKR